VFSVFWAHVRLLTGEEGPDRHADGALVHHPGFLEQHGVEFALLQRRMTTEAKAASLATFRTDPNVSALCPSVYPPPARLSVCLSVRALHAALPSTQLNVRARIVAHRLFMARPHPPASRLWS
jgi:hypothetical protein